MKSKQRLVGKIAKKGHIAICDLCGAGSCACSCGRCGYCSCGSCSCGSSNDSSKKVWY